MDLISLFRGILGIVIILGIAFLLSNNKRKVNWRLVISGLLLQITLAILIIKGEELGNFFLPLRWVKDIFSWIGGFFVLVLNFTTDGAQFIFGTLALGPGNAQSMGVFFAFQVLPTIIFFASLMAILYYLGIMQRIVQGMAWIMARIMGTSGAESLSCTANIFVGQTEAPLMIKPYIKGTSQSELLTIMTGGMATIAGGVMAAYIQILGSAFAESMNLGIQEAQLLFATHLLGASVMAAPAALLISKIIYPETTEPETKGTVKVKVEKNASNVIEAAAAGASEGLTLALNVAAMLIAFIAIIALFNYGLNVFGQWSGLNEITVQNFGQPLGLQLLFGIVLQFLAYGIGVPWHESLQFGSLIGSKVVLNEFVAYLEMGQMISLKLIKEPKTIIMATYALCGFANFSSIAIQIGGISPLAPERRKDLAKLGIRAVIGGTMATLLTATMAGIMM